MTTQLKMVTSALLAASGVALAGAAFAGPMPTAAPAAPSIGTPVKSVVTPGIIGNTVQVGAGPARVGATRGLVGPQGTPTTVVGVSALTKTNPPQGSLATVGVADANTLLNANVAPQ